jgi:hypothetical protein
MTMRSPIAAILWECWRVTRGEIVWRLAGGIVAASLVLVLFTVGPRSEAVKSAGAAIALVILVAPNLTGWLSFAKLNGGRPGFPLHLLYTQPVRTAVLVGIPMAYRTVGSAAIYLVSAFLLRGTFGAPFPLLPVAAWIAVLNVLLAGGNWLSRSRVVQMFVMMVVAARWVVVGMDPLTGEIDFQDSTSVWPTLFHITPSGYAWMGVICLAAFGVTVAAVERQRHGDGRASIPWSGIGFPAPLTNLFRFACPTSSAMRAQVWFELRSRGLPLLAIGAAVAILNLLLHAVSWPIDAALTGEFRSYVNCPRGECFHVRAPTMLLTMMSVPAMLALGGNAFGILGRQGRASVSPFEVTQPYDTGQLAVLKVLVQSVCLLLALSAVGVSVWVSLIGAGEIFGDPLRGLQRALNRAAGALRADELIALAVVGCIAVFVMVASRAVFGALWTRYPRPLNIAGSLFLLYGVALGLLALNDVPLAGILRATSWAIASAILCVTIYLAWRTLEERLLTLSQGCGILLLAAMFTAAWLRLLGAAGVSVTGMPAADAVRMLSVGLMPLTISVLAPWVYSRVRHT